MNRKPLITVVEHDPMLSMLLLEALAAVGNTTMLWTECRGAIEFIRRMTPDLLILDLRLRCRGDGWQVFNNLQCDPATRQIPIILCADDSMLFQMEEARPIEQAAAVLEKPFEIDRLLAIVTEVLKMEGTARQQATRPTLVMDTERQPDAR